VKATICVTVPLWLKGYPCDRAAEPVIASARQAEAAEAENDLSVMRMNLHETIEPPSSGWLTVK
jgi:hypothetical protein